ncbi:MAG TPA: MATE family efflux transporter [Methylomirabilota bacterium]
MIVAAPPVVKRSVDDRTHRLLDGPILPTLVALAAPNAAVTALQAAASVVDAYVVASLGVEALAGVTLVFPLVMLTGMMSAGGMGGGVSSAVARALGAGRRRDADALVIHATVLAVAFAAVFTAGALGGGAALYGVLGGRGGTLDAALAYSDAYFLGVVAVWLANTLANVVRGTGNMALPAALIVAGALVQIGLSVGLVHGLGPLPRLGVAGAGWAAVIAFGGIATLLAAYLGSGRALVRFRASRLEWRLFREILRVGLPGVATNLMANATVLLLTGLVGRFGTAALAGYGIGSRLEYLQIPIVFGMGTALVAMVGTNVGAGRHERAERIAWTGAAIAGAVTGAIGLTAAVVPGAWTRLFTADPAVASVATTYLRIVGPAYALFGIGLALYFASQGAGRLRWPVVASVVRLGLAIGGGWAAVTPLGGALPSLFVAMALALVAYGGLTAWAVRAGAWR